MPLNNQLYVRMKHQFGAIEIANQGEQILISGTSVLRNGRPGSNIAHPGEYYRVNCPFCNDTRRRLWINHSYGMIDPANGQPMTYLAICYNEDCLTDEYNRKLLREMLLGIRNRSTRVIDWSASSGMEVPVQQLREMPWPGNVTEIQRLHDGHVVVRYLTDRGFAKDRLGRFGVMYCTQADGRYPLVGNRIIAPVYMNSVRVGWQARYVGEPIYRGIPKYYTCPGMHKSRVLYNFDHARCYPFVVVVEGITDVWRIGDQAVALLGKSLSSQQSTLLKDTWENKPIIVVMDSDAHEEAGRIVDVLAASGGNPAVSVRLPAGKDPADLPDDEIWDAIHSEAQRVGILLS